MHTRTQRETLTRRHFFTQLICEAIRDGKTDEALRLLNDGVPVDARDYVSTQPGPFAFIGQL